MLHLSVSVPYNFARVAQETLQTGPCFFGHTAKQMGDSQQVIELSVDVATNGHRAPDGLHVRLRAQYLPSLF